MSQASDMIAEVKGLVVDLEKDIKSFEKQIEQVGEFTNLLHLNKARIHLGLLRDELAGRRGNVEDAQLAELEEQEKKTVEPVPEPVVTPEPTPEPVAPVDDPAAGLVGAREAPAA